MHMMSKTDLSAEKFGKSRLPTTVMTANGSIDTTEEAIAHVKDLDMFVTVQLLEDTLAVLSLGRLCEEIGYSCELVNEVKHTFTGSAEDSADNTKELTPDDQDTTKASRNRLKDMPEWL